MKNLIRITAIVIIIFYGQQAIGQSKQFFTTELHFGCPGLAEEFSFTWDEATGKVTGFYWNHGGEIWFLHKNAGKVVRDEKTLYDYDVYLNVTTTGYESTAYQIRGKVSLTVVRTDGAAFGGLWEGTGVYWLGANGIYKKVK